MTTVQALWFRADDDRGEVEPDYQAFTQMDVLNVASPDRLARSSSASVKTCGAVTGAPTIQLCRSTQPATRPRSSRSGPRTRSSAAAAGSTATRSSTRQPASRGRVPSSTPTRSGGAPTSGCMQKIYDVEIDLERWRRPRPSAGSARSGESPAAPDVPGRGREQYDGRTDELGCVNPEFPSCRVGEADVPRFRQQIAS